ncbi:hypothetical protein FGG08_002342 [Glutinoglossum americanum]|uniref:Uncharacterized protein n=1 Tax=Glutinoglossum americanum TaxID=1670608 RepID=A0A9P8I092_9PEZI|nr:hypothetical protein FGG08_002342 [Glutinoglossum americanum]
MHATFIRLTIMAPGKKKKKATSNPARGFATTSIASKPKREKQDTIPEMVDLQISASIQVDTTSSSVVELPADTGNPKELHELTPGDLEEQLEESELQVLVEKHASNCKRQSTRQASKLQRDLRLLRMPAEPMNVRKWLSPELMEQILCLVSQDIRNGNFRPEPGSIPKLKEPMQEDLVAKLWTLKLSLLALSFPEQNVKEALQQVLENVSVTGDLTPASKENIWGLPQALDWLALTCERSELPDYDRRPQHYTPNETPQNSGASTPSFNSPEKKDASATRGISNVLQPGFAFRDSSLVDEAMGTSRKVSEHAQTKDYNQASDQESDLEPDELISSYLSIKSQLYELQPHLIRSFPRTRKSKLPRSNHSADESSTTPEIKRLLNKLKKIESDVLFDQHEADAQWTDKCIEIERENAMRKELGLHPAKIRSTADLSLGAADEIPQAPQGLNPVSPGSAYAEYGIEDDEDGSQDDDVGMLGELFTSLPETLVDPLTGSSSMVMSTAKGPRVIIREFGKWTGVSPRRVLEEACRSRDSKVRLLYKVISSSSFSNRHSLKITWSKDQPPIRLSSLSSVSSLSDSRSMTFEMTTASTPNIAQSESYISVAALFLVFHTSQKEEKVYLRLPSVWRDLWGEFVETYNERTDEADRDELRNIKALVQNKLDMEDNEGVILTKAFQKRNAAANDQGNKAQKDTEADAYVNRTPEQLKELWRQKSSTYNFQKMLGSRVQLPMWNFRKEVLEAIDRQQVVIICGETGCGKSTQIPSFVLEHELSRGKPCKIYCTEPRRISAISLARRVSEELGERKNDLGTPRSMVLDEVHERSIDSDFMLIVLRKLIVRRPDLKVILMSATMDAQRFSSYLGGAPVLTVPGRTFPVETKYLEDAIELTEYVFDESYNSSSRANLDDIDTDGVSDSINPSSAKDLRGAKYSARTRKTLSELDEYRIDYDLIAKLIEKIATDSEYIRYSKAILIFLPGMGEIKQLNNILLAHPSFASGWNIFPLHSTIASEEQELAFLVPPEGIRKIVLATNIAETGITIPDSEHHQIPTEISSRSNISLVTCVVDTGKHKEMRFDERRQLSRLVESFISRANAKQRRGRAGRVQEGKATGLCFHLFTKERHDKLLAEQQMPELLRLSLQDLVLRVKICKLGNIEETLSEALDPPLAKNVRRAIDALIDVKALTPSEELTPLGQQLAKFPLDVYLGKLILLGSVFRCLDLTLTLAAILSSKTPFSSPMAASQQAKLARIAFKRGESDLLTVWNAYSAWRRVCSTQGESELQFCRKNYLSSQTLSNIEDLKQQLVVSVVDSGFLELTESERVALNKARFSRSRRRDFFTSPDRVNVNSENDLIADTVIAWSFYPKLLIRDGKGWRNIANNQPVSVSPTSSPNAHETSAAEDFAIALLCGDADFRMYAGVITIDGNKLRFSVPDWKTMLAIKILRIRLKEVLSRSFKTPGKPLPPSLLRWFEIWQRIFTREERK